MRKGILSWKKVTVLGFWVRVLCSSGMVDDYISRKKSAKKLNLPSMAYSANFLLKEWTTFILEEFSEVSHKQEMVTALCPFSSKFLVYFLLIIKEESHR